MKAGNKIIIQLCNELEIRSIRANNKNLVRDENEQNEKIWNLNLRDGK